MPIRQQTPPLLPSPHQPGISSAQPKRCNSTAKKGKRSAEAATEYLLGQWPLASLTTCVGAVRTVGGDLTTSGPLDEPPRGGFFHARVVESSDGLRRATCSGASLGFCFLYYSDCRFRPAPVVSEESGVSKVRWRTETKGICKLPPLQCGPYAAAKSKIGH